MRIWILNMKMENVNIKIINKNCINDTTLTTPYIANQRESEFCSINVILAYAFNKSFYSIKY